MTDDGGLPKDTNIARPAVIMELLCLESGGFLIALALVQSLKLLLLLEFTMGSTRLTFARIV